MNGLIRLVFQVDHQAPSLLSLVMTSAPILGIYKAKWRLVMLAAFAAAFLLARTAGLAPLLFPDLAFA